MAILVRSDNSKAGVSPADPEKGFTHAELYALIGCSTIEIMHLADGRMMGADKDGRSKRLPVNLFATKLYQDAGGRTGWAVVGNVVICEEGEVDISSRLG